MRLDTTLCRGISTACNMHSLYLHTSSSTWRPNAHVDEGTSAFPQRSAPTRQKRRWANFRHVNGVAVYQEHAEESGEQGAFMVSAVVRASPKACFQVAAGRKHLYRLHLRVQAHVYVCRKAATTRYATSSAVN